MDSNSVDLKIKEVEKEEVSLRSLLGIMNYNTKVIVNSGKIKIFSGEPSKLYNKLTNEVLEEPVYRIQAKGSNTIYVYI